MPYKPPLSRVKLAFRNTVADQVQEFKDNNRLTGEELCPITGQKLNPATAQADHFPKSFASILAGFLEHEKLRVEAVAITSLRVKGRLVLQSCSLAERWKTWHKEHSTFRWTSAYGNKKQSDMGFRSRKKAKVQ